METFTLRIESPQSFLGFTGTDSPQTAQFEGWTLREAYSPTSDEFPDKPVGVYCLFVERELPLHDDDCEWQLNAVDLIERIERVWAFATGAPLGHAGFGLRLVMVDVPAGWRSNTEEFEDARAAVRGTYRGKFLSGHRDWAYVSWWPLPRVVAALSGLSRLTDVERELLELHYAAYTSPSSHGREVLFAKGLEIVRALLPGRTDKQKALWFPEEVREEMTFDFHTLFDISNNRLETRHAITHRPSVALHPPLAGGEAIAFLQDADTAIRALICDRLGLEPIRLVPRGSAKDSDKIG